MLPGTSIAFYPFADNKHSDFSLYDVGQPWPKAIPDPVSCIMVATPLPDEWRDDWYNFLPGACYNGGVSFNELLVWPGDVSDPHPFLFSFSLVDANFVAGANTQPPGGDNGQFSLWNGDHDGSLFC